MIMFFCHGVAGRVLALVSWGTSVFPCKSYGYVGRYVNVSICCPIPTSLFFLDWFCFYYSIRNNLVALLAVPFARIFFFKISDLGVLSLLIVFWCYMNWYFTSNWNWVGKQEFEALQKLATTDPFNVIKSILNPKANFVGDYVNNELAPNVLINESQKRTLNALNFALEKIQGPPGMLDITMLSCMMIDVDCMTPWEIVSDFAGSSICLNLLGFQISACCHLFFWKCVCTCVCARPLPLTNPTSTPSN